MIFKVLCLFLMMVCMGSSTNTEKPLHLKDILRTDLKDEIVNQYLKADLPDKVKTRIKEYRQRLKEYKENDVPAFSNLDFYQKVVLRDRREMEKIIYSLINMPEIEKYAKDFSNAVQISYEWEGASGPPLGEADSAKEYLTKNPNTPVRPYIDLFLIYRYGIGYSLLLNERKQDHEMEKTVDPRMNHTAVLNNIKVTEKELKEVPEKYRKYLNEALNSSDPLVQAIADDEDRCIFNEYKNHPLKSKPLAPIAIPTALATPSPLLQTAGIPDADGHIPWEKIRGQKWDGLDMELGPRSEMQNIIDKAADGSIADIPEGVYHGSVVANKRHGLTVRGKPGKTWLVLEEQDKDIMVVNDCENVRIEGLGMIHHKTSKCRGDVLVIHSSRRVSIETCDLSGCGVTGIKATNTQDLDIEGCYIHDCSGVNIEMHRVNNAAIHNNLIKVTEDATDGIKLGLVTGKVDIFNNTFVMENSPAITVLKSGKYPYPFADTKIFKNIFCCNRLIGKMAIRDLGVEPQNIQLCLPAMSAVEIKDNCFDTFETTKIDEVILKGAKVEKNVSTKIELDDNFKRISPKEYQDRGAPDLPWINFKIELK
jgi:hypothetical protein